MIDYTQQRVGVFVDVQNMYYSARALYEQRVDFGEILQAAVGDRQLVRAFAYVIQTENGEEQTFFDALEDRGYELRKKDLLTYYGGNKKGDWDVGLAMDVVRMAPRVDVIVIVSGDGDFKDLVEYAQGQGCRVEVLAWGSSTSSTLREAVNEFVDLSDDTQRFLIPKKRSRGGSRPQARTKKRPTGKTASANEIDAEIESNTQAGVNKKPATSSSSKSAGKSSNTKKPIARRRAPKITT